MTTKMHPDCKRIGECHRAYFGPMPGCSGVCLREYPEHAQRRPVPIKPALSSIDRRPGPDVVLDELASTGAAALLSEASRLYSASGTPGIDAVEWTSLGAGTVRMWVAVAREARAIHDYGGVRVVRDGVVRP